MPMTGHHRTGAELPRPLIAVGVPCVGVLLVAFFVARGFPYDELGVAVANRIERAHGIQLVVGELHPALQLAGPALEGTQVRATFPAKEPLQISRLLARSAWSLSWLAGEPALHVELESPVGNADGTLWWGEVTAWKGDIRDARPEQPPISDWIPTGRLEGLLEASLDIKMGELGPDGAIAFEIRDGSITLPELRVPLPFETLTGELTLGGDAYATVTALSFEGPIVSGSGTGKIGQAATLEQAPLAFEFQLNVKPALSGAVRAAGLQVDPEGATAVRVLGTVGRPIIR